jgi:diguanylate cyclase (GGDEF)-like protein/PAS domain S-box-containing protein
VNQPTNNELRRIAKTRLQAKATPASELPVEDAHKLLHELQVHQIELEMQNEALREASDAEGLALHRYTELFDFAPIGYFTLDRNSTITQVNLRGANMLGLERLNLTGQRFLTYVTQEHRVRFSDCMAKAFETGDKQNFEILVQVDKQALGFSLEVNTGVTETDCLVAMTDITKRKLAEEKLERIAHYDLLTNLPNRVLLADRLSQAMMQCQRRKRSVAVAYLDLDGFKTVNDTHGHDMGDKLLIALSQRIKEALREGDTLARVGGDEFIAVMADLEKIKNNNPVLERLLKAAADPVTIGDTVLQVSASIGVTLYPQDGANTDQLIRHADQAMYIAKQAGKNRYHLFDPILDKEIKFQQESINDIRSALDRHEFVLHYQPKVNMNTGEVIGVEALIRWQHPYQGLVPPLEFLPVIEGRVISLELGEWVIATALTQIIQWQNIGINLPISVNISAYQLQQGNFATRLEALLAVHPKVNPRCLELEILETSALSDIDLVLDTMNACHELGVRFALDDFGTGYSSLTYLRRLPAYLIKIDQSFVRNMLEDSDDLAIVESVVGLAKAFQREVIAEGVETIAHGVALWQLGCELAQGYGIARPMPASDIPEWVSSWIADGSGQIQSLIGAKTNSRLLTESPRLL